MLQVDKKRDWKDCMSLIHNKNLGVIGITIFGLCSRNFKKKPHDLLHDLDLNISLQLCFSAYEIDVMILLSLLPGSFIDVKQYENANF